MSPEAKQKVRKFAAESEFVAEGKEGWNNLSSLCIPQLSNKCSLNLCFCLSTASGEIDDILSSDYKIWFGEDSTDDCMQTILGTQFQMFKKRFYDLPNSTTFR